ncbi:regulatory protein RecX [Piscinibacter sp.]|uniref:regulatory protein RecX n=1 Tax=Piscinibacter sp. TaxID=1903157 RepID=UPI002BCEE774|nr:regulatory protein RecX [Albitalea sp.]HUG22963.1 regulatory protein RecX [Albitalea sp.]
MATKKPGLSLKGRALALLAQREHSAPELRRKLLRHVREEVAADAGNADTADADPSGDAAARVEAVLEWLQAHDYLSETRFVESRVHARVSRYGNLRIRQELALHGLALDAEAAQALKDSELDRAADVWRRKFGVPPADAPERARQSRFLAQRGFSPEVIARLMRRAG